jgi:hypothetical protein
LDYSWFRASISRFVDSEEAASQVLRVTVHGVQQISKSDRIARAVDDFDRLRAELPNAPPYDPEQGRAKIEQADSLAEWARAELQREFRTLAANASVSTWAALEAFVEDLVVGCLEHNPNLIEHEEFAKLKVPLAEFMALTEDERRRALVEELSKRTGVGSRAGIGRFERLLCRRTWRRCAERVQARPTRTR